MFTLDVAAVDAVGSPIDTAAPPLLALIHKVSAQAVSTSRSRQSSLPRCLKLLARRRRAQITGASRCTRIWAVRWFEALNASQPRRGTPDWKNSHFGRNKARHFRQSV